MSYHFNYNYGTDAWYLSYEPDSPSGYPDPEYDLPGVVPEGDWSLYGEVFGITDDAAVGLLVKMDDDTVVQWLGTWQWDVPLTGEEGVWVHQESANIPLRILYHSAEGVLDLQYLSQGVWQSAQLVSVATPVDTGLILRYGIEDQRAAGYIGGVRLLEGTEEPDGFAEPQMAPASAPPPQVVQMSVQVSGEPTVYALLGAPFGDLEFDVGKSARWLEYFSDKLFVLDVNLGDPRYWIVNWAMTFPDAEHGVTSINYFYRPAEFRKELFRQADRKFHMEDDAWTIWVDASEGLSFDTASLPDDYASNPFMSFIYREIARAEEAERDFAALPFFVFLRSDEVQNVTYDHRSNSEDDDSLTVLQPVSVPYYMTVDPGYPCAMRLIKVSKLRDPDFAWNEIDEPFSSLADDPKAQVISYAYAHWNLQDIPPDQTEVPALSIENDDGWRMRKMISMVRPIPELPFDSNDATHVYDMPPRTVEVAGSFTMAIRFKVTAANCSLAGIRLAVSTTNPPGNQYKIKLYDGSTLVAVKEVPVVSDADNDLLFDTPVPLIPDRVYQAAVYYGALGWYQRLDTWVGPGVEGRVHILSQAEASPLTVGTYVSGDGYPTTEWATNVPVFSPIISETFLQDWRAPSDDPVGVPGPWAAYTVVNTHPDFVPITDTEVTGPDAATALICTPLYDCVFRLNMRDGVWYEGEASGNTPLTWDSVNEKWTTPYNPDTWPDYGVRAGENPEYVDPPTPTPPEPS